MSAAHVQRPNEPRDFPDWLKLRPAVSLREHAGKVFRPVIRWAGLVGRKVHHTLWPLLDALCRYQARVRKSTITPGHHVLAAMAGISHSSVRRGLYLLAQLGLIDYAPGGGRMLDANGRPCGRASEIRLHSSLIDGKRAHPALVEGNEHGQDPGRAEGATAGRAELAAPRSTDTHRSGDWRVWRADRAAGSSGADPPRLGAPPRPPG